MLQYDAQGRKVAEGDLTAAHARTEWEDAVRRCRSPFRSLCAYFPGAFPEFSVKHHRAGDGSAPHHCVPSPGNLYAIQILQFAPDSGCIHDIFIVWSRYHALHIPPQRPATRWLVEEVTVNLDEVHPDVHSLFFIVAARRGLATATRRSPGLSPTSPHAR